MELKMHKFNNCVKVQLEIGHEASLRSEVTSQGFTHDWVVFVRGIDNAEIHHFIEKVVFNLHESFHKPKRVVKEPPYEVKESGYASFTFPIDVYFKSKDDPRKLQFTYDLTLNTSGPVRVSHREKALFNNPSEEFRRKLIKGGGVGVGNDMLPLTDNNSQNTDDKSSKKSSSDSSKKHKNKESLKPEEVRSSNQFTDLFGTPIKTAKLSPTTAPGKKISDTKHSSESKVSSKSATKHSPHKEKEREKEKESSKKDTMITSSSKEKEKDRDRSKEKEKKPDKSLKRPPSPSAVPAPAKTMKEELKKSGHEESKEKDKVKTTSSDISKNEKKEKKKDKKNRDEKDKKDRHKDHESKKETAAPPTLLPPPNPAVKDDKFIEKEKTKSDYKDLKENVKKSPKNIIKDEKTKEKSDKDKVDIVEKQKHKHKKKEKSKKEDKEPKEKEKDKSAKKSEKQPSASPIIQKEPSPPPPPKSKARSPSPKPQNPLRALMSELGTSDKGSDTESSGDEEGKSAEKGKTSPTASPTPPPTAASRSPERVREDKYTKEKVKKKEKKSSAREEDGTKKKKRKTKDKEEVVPEKLMKTKDDDHKINRDDSVDEDMDDRLSEGSMVASPQREEERVSRSPSPSTPTKFTEEYVMELKDLQQKIMTLEDNTELQRVVQVIAETGQYEITKKTFDFDLCALDKRTVKRLQELFFAAS